MRRWLVVAALVALGCSGGGSSTLSHDQLESELRQLRSLDAETGLVEEEMAVRHVTRGFARGLIFARDGTLVASVAQEGLLRERRAPDAG